MEVALTYKVTSSRDWWNLIAVLSEDEGELVHE